MSSRFIHLHNHSHYSIGDAISKVSDIFELTQKYNMSSVALTDHGNMFGAAEFFMEAQKYPNINAIIGCEMYVSPESMTEKPSSGKKNYYHLLLLAQNEIGYRNLSKLVSLASLEGFYYRPRVDYKTLAQYSEGIIASSACLGGEISQLILQKQLQEAHKKTLFFQEMFGKDNFFLELMYHGLPEQKLVNQEIIKIASQTGIPLIATNDVHYPYQGDDLAHDAFLCIQEGKKIHDPARKKYHSKEFFFKTEEEMMQAMKEFSIEAVTNTLHVAQKCSYKPHFGELHIPHFETPKNNTELEYLKELCNINLPKRYTEITPAIKERLEYELSVIERMGFASYFLIVQDFIQYAKSNDISVGPGRGSAAGSLVAFLLGITDLEPLKYNLLFERFLNPGRISMPDIDTDFDDTKRDEIIKYVTQKYGQDKVAQIIAFGKMKAKSVIRDVGRVLDIPLTETDTLAKLIPNNMGLKQAYESTPELKEKIDSSPTNTKMYNLSLRLENSIRQTSTHAAGIIIGKDTLTDFVPLHKDRKTGAIITQFEGKNLEEFGLLKMDFLGLRNLRIIRNALEKIKVNTGKSIHFEKIPLNDKKTYQSIFKEGKGIAIFQCESPGMRALMKKMQPSSFEDIIALIALFRPGPLKSGMADDFITNKKLPTKKIPFPHPDLEEILRDTYGVIVYQEQIMQISQKVAGFSLADADNLRKAMGKKDAKKMDSMATLFKQGAEKNGYSPEFSYQLFDNMAKFAEYGFNKSHSAAYALIAFQTAYLKAHYPVEYMCSVLSAESSTVESLTKYIQECQSMNVKVLPPDINKSGIDFNTEGSNIRFGLSAIKNVGEKNILQIIQEREKNGDFTSILDLIARTNLNKKVLEGLCFGAALDSLDMNRATIIKNLDAFLSFSTALKNNTQTGMADLFGEQTTQEKSLKIEQMVEFPPEEILKMEKENLGFYATSHPLDSYRQDIENLSSHSTFDLKMIKDSLNNEDQEDMDIPNTANMVGRIINLQIKTTKNNEQMAIFNIEDLESEMGMVIFPKSYKQYQDILNTKEPLFFNMRVDFSKYELQGIVNYIHTLEEEHTKRSKSNTGEQTVLYSKLSDFKKSQDRSYSKTKKEYHSTQSTIPEKIMLQKLNLEIDYSLCSPESVNQIKDILEKFPGKNIRVLIHLIQNGEKNSLALGEEFNIIAVPILLQEIQKLPFIIKAEYI